MLSNLSLKLDQFYTNEKISKNCIDFLKKNINNFHSYFFIEPSAGTGSFFNNLDTNHKLGFDLDPKSLNILFLDFFDFNTLDFSHIIQNKPIITIGNPPFGKNSSLALKFLNKASEFSDFVAFILPKTFKKQSFINKISPQLHLVAELELPLNSFIFNDTPYDVPCVFQIWQKKSEPRHILKLSKSHPDFEFTDKQNADFAIRRVGVLAGKVITDFQSYSEQSHYYIKSHIPIYLLIQKLTSISWDSVKYNTAGNPSISKSELIQLYSKI